jgi:hypothetical protein
MFRIRPSQSASAGFPLFWPVVAISKTRGNYAAIYLMMDAAWGRDPE